MFCKNFFYSCTQMSVFLLAILQKPDAVLSGGFYNECDRIVNLNDKNFDKTIMNSKDIWVVEYYAAWCPYSHSLIPEMKALGRMQDTFKIAAIDGDKNSKISDRYNIIKYPSIKIFGVDKKTKPIKYDGKMRAKDIANAARKLVRKD